MSQLRFLSFSLITASVGGSFHNEAFWPLHFVLTVKEQHTHEV
jgi:hypothetical protein